MLFKVGDRVHLLDEEGEGVITELLNANLVVIDIDGFTYEYNVANIIKVNSNNEVVRHLDVDYSNLNSVSDKERKKEIRQVFKKVFDSVSQSGYPEIDLHIYELVENPKFLSNTEMLQIQIHRLEHFIQEALMSKVTEFIVIHGVGEGVLKQEIRLILNSHGNMEYWDADFREYGSGATHVRVRGLFAL